MARDLFSPIRALLRIGGVFVCLQWFGCHGFSVVTTIRFKTIHSSIHPKAAFGATCTTPALSSAAVVSETHDSELSSNNDFSEDNQNNNDKDSDNEVLVHTLLLCRHGDSIWNGKTFPHKETFTGWTDVPLSQQGIQEAKATAAQLSPYLSQVDVCATSLLQRAQLTAHYCLWQNDNNILSPKKQAIHRPPLYVLDYRLNERHYGALQGLVKQDIEDGKVPGYNYSKQDVQAWRRSWYAIPPLIKDNKDPRRLAEIQRYQNYCEKGADNVPRGESLNMVAQDRIEPFLQTKLTPLLEKTAASSNNDKGGTALIVAHANSLRALIGVLCGLHLHEDGSDDEKDCQKAVLRQKVEAMKIPTALPLVMQYTAQKKGQADGKYMYELRACPELIWQQQSGATVLGGETGAVARGGARNTSKKISTVASSSDLPVWPLSCLPFATTNNNPTSAVVAKDTRSSTTTTTMMSRKRPLPSATSQDDNKLHQEEEEEVLESSIPVY